MRTIIRELAQNVQSVWAKIQQAIDRFNQWLEERHETK
jgi:hypothetical protein